MTPVRLPPLLTVPGAGGSDGRNYQAGRDQGLVRTLPVRHLGGQDVPSSQVPGAMPPAGLRGAFVFRGETSE